MSSTSIARVFSHCVLVHERLREEGAAPPLTPPPLPPHATDTCSRCSQVIRWADNLKITIFNIFFTFSKVCTWASFEALLGGGFVVAFWTAFPLSVTFAPDSFCIRSVEFSLRLVHTFLASVAAVSVFRLRCNGAHVRCRMSGPGARYGSGGQMRVNIYGI